MKAALFPDHFDDDFEDDDDDDDFDFFFDFDDFKLLSSAGSQCWPTSSISKFDSSSSGRCFTDSEFRATAESLPVCSAMRRIEAAKASRPDSARRWLSAIVGCIDLEKKQLLFITNNFSENEKEN